MIPQMRNGILGCLLVALGLSIGVGTAVSGAQSGAEPPQPTGLPDLVMHKIEQVKVYPWYTNAGKTVRRKWGLRFSSTVDNPGPGHFIIHAHRARVGSPCPPTEQNGTRCEKGDMTADQVVLLPDGATRTYKHVASLYFDESHFHWHLRHASRYELRTADGRRVVRRDSKTGFCFGDRHPLTGPSHVEYPPLTDGLATCLYGSTADVAQDGRRALELTEGLSAGYGDDYTSFKDGHPLQGQELLLNGLKAGRYQLINRTNATGRLHELKRSNDASSVAFSLRWPHGPKARPAVKVLKNCGGKPRCHA